MFFAAAQRAASPVAQLDRSPVDTGPAGLDLDDMQSRSQHSRHKVLGALENSTAAHVDPGDRNLWHLEVKAGPVVNIHAVGRNHCFQRESKSPDGSCWLLSDNHLKSSAKCRSYQSSWDPILAPLGRDNHHEGLELTAGLLLPTPFVAENDMQ